MGYFRRSVYYAEKICVCVVVFLTFCLNYMFTISRLNKNIKSLILIYLLIFFLHFHSTLQITYILLGTLQLVKPIIAVLTCMWSLNCLIWSQAHICLADTHLFR